MAEMTDPRPSEVQALAALLHHWTCASHPDTDGGWLCQRGAADLNARGVRVTPSPTEDREHEQYCVLDTDHQGRCYVKRNPDWLSVAPSPAPVPEGPYVLTPERVVPLLRSIVASGERLYSEDVDAIASALAAPVAPDRTEGLDVEALERLIDVARFDTLTADDVPYAKNVDWNKGWAAAVEAIRRAAIKEQSHE